MLFLKKNYKKISKEKLLCNLPFKFIRWIGANWSWFTEILSEEKLEQKFKRNSLCVADNWIPNTYCKEKNSKLTSELMEGSKKRVNIRRRVQFSQHHRKTCEWKELLRWQMNRFCSLFFLHVWVYLRLHARTPTYNVYLYNGLPYPLAWRLLLFILHSYVYIVR